MFQVILLTLQNMNHDDIIYPEERIKGKVYNIHLVL